MKIILDAPSSVPLYVQIAAGVRGALARGELESGERLPAARSLAEVLDVNLHTVLRAYAELRDEGLIDLRRGRGATVVAPAGTGHAEVLARARALVDAARRLGMGRERLFALVEEVL